MTLLKIKKRKRKPGSRADLTRRKIAVAAAAQIEQGGPTALSLRKLAKSLGVSPTTISSHFKGGLTDLEEEIIRAILADVAPPFEPKQEPSEYMENLFYSTLKALQGHPAISMLTILCITRNPFVAPKLAERSLASLGALGVAPPNMASAYRSMLRTLFDMILSGPVHSSQAKSEDSKPAHPPLTLMKSEYPYVSKFRESVLDDLAEAAFWTPEPQAAKTAVLRLIEELNVG